MKNCEYFPVNKELNNKDTHYIKNLFEHGFLEDSPRNHNQTSCNILKILLFVYARYTKNNSNRLFNYN